MMLLEKSRGPAQTRGYPQPPADYLYIMTSALFALTMVLSISLVKYGIPGLPFRALVAILILGVTLIGSPPTLPDAVKRVSGIIGVVAVCAAIGTLASVLNNASFEQIARQLLEIHVQAVIGLVVGACLVRTCGPAMVARVMAFAVGLSTIVAAMQFVGIGAAWELRMILQRMQPLDPTLDTVFLTLRSRAMGLSFSPVHLGTQSCLAFAIWFSYAIARHPDLMQGRFDGRLMIPIGLFVFAAVVTGNRSPLLGMVAFMLLYLFLVRPAIATVMLIVFLPFAILIDDLLLILQDMGIRAAQVDDGSSSNRKVLRAYGFMLLAERPYGYGLSFNSPDYWFLFWDRLKDYPNAVAIRVHALHNYFMMILNKYGFLIVFVGAWIGWKMLKNFFVILAFTPYLVHIFYHNDGPLQGDFMIWFLLPAIVVFQTAAARHRNQRSSSPVRRAAPA